MKFTSNLLALCLTTVFALSPNIAIASQATIISAQPQQLSFGRSQTVEINIKNNHEDANIVLLAGGPFVAKKLSTKAGLQHIVAGNRYLYGINNKNQLLIIDANTSPAPIIKNRLQLKSQISHIAYFNQRLFLVERNQQLSIYRVDAQQQLSFQASYSAKKPINDLVVEQESIFLLLANKTLARINYQASANNAKTLQLSQPANIELDFFAHKVVVRNDIAFFTGPKFGIVSINVSSPPLAKILDQHKTNGSGENIRLFQNNAFIADGRGGLVVFDISRPKNIRWIGSHNKLIDIRDVAINGDTAIVNDADTRLVSINISKLELPITASFFKPETRINDFIFSQQHAYIALPQGLHAIDFSTPADVQISNEGINQGGSRRAFIEDNIAYVADWFSGLHIYDISIPNEPRHLGNYHTPGSSKGVVVKDKIAYVGDDDHGLQIIDVSNPRKPVKISEILSTGLAYTMKLVGNLIYLADHRGGFHIIDVTNPKQPHIIGSYDTPGKSWAIDVYGKLAFVADDTSGLLIFNVSDPKKPKQIGQFNPNGYAEDVKIIGQRAYVSFFDKGFYILDIAQPQKPKIISHTPIPGNARSVSIRDTHAFIASWESGMQVVDFSNERSPKIVGQFDTQGSSWGLDLHQQYAYIWDWWGGIKVVDINKPEQPRWVAQYQGRGQLQSLSIQDNFLFTASGSGGMQVYDINNPLNPIWVTGVDLSGFARDIWTNPTHAFVAMGDEGVAIAETIDPFYAHWKAQIKTTGNAYLVRESNGVLFIADSIDGLSWYDVSLINNIKKLGQINTQIRDLALNNSQVFIIDQQGKLQQFNRLESILLPVASTDGKKQYNKITVNGNVMAITVPGKGIELLSLNKEFINQGSVKGTMSQKPLGESSFKSIGFFETSDDILDIQLPSLLNRIPDNNETSQELLYYSSAQNGLIALDISQALSVKVVTAYRRSGNNTQFALGQGAAFFAGGKSIASLELLPNLHINNNGAEKVSIKFPAQFPIGSYHFAIYENQSVASKLPNAVDIRIRKAKKPKFSMEDFKKILKQKLKSTQ